MVPETLDTFCFKFECCSSIRSRRNGRGKNDRLIQLAEPSPVVVIDNETPHRPNNKRKSGYCLYVVTCTWLYNLGSLTSKRKRCSLLKLLLVKLSSPGLGLVFVVALSLMSTSLQRKVSCSSLASHAYASFLTTRTETERTGVGVRLKEQQTNLFPIIASRDPRKSPNYVDKS